MDPLRLPGLTSKNLQPLRQGAVEQSIKERRRENLPSCSLIEFIDPLETFESLRSLVENDDSGDFWLMFLGKHSCLEDGSLQDRMKCF